jgi:signal transduction histidine kinase
VRRGSRVCLEVQDYGCGFDPSAVRPSHGSGEGMGLSGMRERIALVGGGLTIRSRPGSGTSVIAEVPLPPSEGVGGEHEG